MPATQQQTDRDHLRMLAIFHFVLGGFSALGIGFIFLHRLMMESIFTSPHFTKSPGGAPPPEVFAIMEAMYWVMGGLIVIQMVVTLLSGYFLWHRRHRVFSMAVAGFNCLNIPLGTVLGVFTLVVLLRESVEHAYAEQQNHRASGGQ